MFENVATLRTIYMDPTIQRQLLSTGNNTSNTAAIINKLILVVVQKLKYLWPLNGLLSTNSLASSSSATSMHLVLRQGGYLCTIDLDRRHVGRDEPRRARHQDPRHTC